MTQLGNLYGFGGGGYGSAVYGYGDPSFAYGVQEVRGYRFAAGSGFTGFEGLPNMDGGGINHRYPYHSYRRPWAHPGPVSTNVNIVW